MGSDFTYRTVIFKKEKYVRVDAQGSITLDDLKAMYASVLKNPQYKSGMSRLWDFTHLDATALTSDDLKAMLKYMKHSKLGTDSVYSAVLVSRDFMYGLIRMLQIMGDDILSPNIIVTKDPNEALVWVTKRDKSFART
jgi:hypothetical protein